MLVRYVAWKCRLGEGVQKSEFWKTPFKYGPLPNIDSWGLRWGERVNSYKRYKYNVQDLNTPCPIPSSINL